jgi:hypothetical protein
MPKIEQKTLVPYNKTLVPKDQGASSLNVSNALSTRPPEFVETKKQFFGVVFYKAAISEHLDNTASPSHLFSVKNSWKNRKTP